MTNWKPIETIPKDRWILGREDISIYKCKYDYQCPDTKVIYYKSLCGQFVALNPEPEEWCEIPE